MSYDRDATQERLQATMGPALRELTRGMTDPRHTLDRMHTLGKALGVLPTDDFEVYANRLQTAMAAIPPQQLAAMVNDLYRSRSRTGELIVGDRPGEQTYAESKKSWVCKACGFIVNEFSDTYGNRQFIHSRSWIQHDHEPEPVEVPRGSHGHMVCDFCCNTGEVNWSYSGDHTRFQAPGSNTLNDYGTDWAACDDCDDFVRVVDVEGLVDRVLRVHPDARKYRDTSMVGTSMAANYRRLYGSYLPSIHSRKRFTPLPPPARLHPRQMPKIRDGLIKFWSHPQAYERFHASGKILSLPGFAYGQEDEFRIGLPGTQIPEDNFNKHARHLVAGLGVADLYYVSSDFTHVAITAGQELADISIRREELPSKFGFLIWEDPIYEVERIDGFMAGIRCVSWTLVPHGIWFNFYVQAEDGDPDYRHHEQSRSELGWLIPPNPGSGLTFGDHGTFPEGAPSQFLRTLLATMFLMTQPGVGQEDIQHADKGLQRAYKRAGRKPPTVRVIDLRRRSQAEREAAALNQELRKISVRFMVRGHWKRQAYGPARSLRKTIYVAPFMKGPDDAPLKTPIPTVKVLR